MAMRALVLTMGKLILCSVASLMVAICEHHVAGVLCVRQGSRYEHDNNDSVSLRSESGRPGGPIESVLDACEFL